jgi:hypothetical protein
VTRVPAAALAALFFSLPTPASAKDMVGSSVPAFGENAPKNYESSQWFSAELKFGPYSPHIDSSPGLGMEPVAGGGTRPATPFSDLFNPQGVVGKQPPARLLTTVEFDVQFLHKFGSLGVGVTTGYYRRSTHSFQFADPTTMTGCTIGSCTRSGDETALNILPLSGLLVYRFDWLMHRYRVPFVPYFKIGLAYYIWWIENGGGTLSTTNIAGGTQPNTTAGKTYSSWGGTFGWVLNPGISFLLDIIDPAAARTMDVELGINHTYLFCELNYADISGFGASDKLVLSDTSLNAGIAFEF